MAEFILLERFFISYNESKKKKKDDLIGSGISQINNFEIIKKLSYLK